MIFLGFILVFIGILLFVFSGEVDVEGGGVIMIGLILIVFGIGRGVILVMILVVFLMVLWIIGIFFVRRG